MTTSESADREREEVWKKVPREERRKYDLQRCTFGGGGVISIGARTNIQDGSVVTAVEDHATIGDGVTVGHLAQIHSATVGDNCLIGMGAVVRELVSIQPESFIAAGAVVPRGTIIPSGQLWVGNPARKLRDLTPEERQKLFYQADEVRYYSIPFNGLHYSYIFMPPSLLGSSC
jgi:carbonic anhydrase/acetyltransferase-like protein (isoleucine patch superfamily)